MIRVGATRRLLHLAILMAVIGFYALVSATWLPAAPLLPLAAVLLFAFIEILLPLPRSAVREVSEGERMLSGDETSVLVTVEPAPLPQNLHLRESVPEGFTLLPSTVEPLRPVSGQRASTEYRLLARRRGTWTFDPPVLYRSSTLGLMERSADVPAQTTITVLPASAKNLGVKIRPRPAPNPGLTTRSVRRGPGDEFFALRQYLPGDNIGDINWKATARSNRLITNEFLPDEPPRYLVYVDTRAAGAEVGQTDVFERTLELSAILMEALVHARAHVGLVLLSFHSLFQVPSGGPIQLRRLRQMIVDARPGFEASIHELLLAGAPHLPATADAVLITPNIYDASLSQALVFLRSRHRRVALLSPGFPEPRGDELEAIAQRAAGALLNAEQLAALEGLRGYADHTVQWPPEEAIAVTLQRLGMKGGRR